MSKIGILALQGAFKKHQEMLTKIGIQTQLVKYADELSSCDGLIIPGGESTVIARHIRERQLTQPLKEFGNNHPIFGTCAGMILMAKEGILSFMDISVKRNAYGAQIASFSTKLNTPCSSTPIDAIFIRAPRITTIHSSEVKVLATYQNEAVLVQQGLHLAASFHPELTEDFTIHQYFAGLCLSKKLIGSP